MCILSGLCIVHPVRLILNSHALLSDEQIAVDFTFTLLGWGASDQFYDPDVSRSAGLYLLWLVISTEHQACSAYVVAVMVWISGSDYLLIL